jgi:choline dehydrogenase-like flavoprotein
MLSGIGNATTLRDLGIKPIINLPSVGQNLQDHPVLMNYFNVSSSDTFDDLLRNMTLAATTIAQWNSTRLGRFSSGTTSVNGFLRLPSNSAVLEKFGDPSAGNTSGHFELMFLDGYAPLVIPQPQTGNFLSVATAVISPSSRGSVTLANSDPFAQPIIDPAFFTKGFDIACMVAAIRSVMEFVSAPAWDDFLLGPLDKRLNAASNETVLEAYARESASTIFHPVGTARMTSSTASTSEGVVNSNLLLKGTRGVRIVDASVLPEIPCGHIVGVVYTIAERAAELIKQDWAGYIDCL